MFYSPRNKFCHKRLNQLAKKDEHGNVILVKDGGDGEETELEDKDVDGNITKRRGYRILPQQGVFYAPTPKV